MNRFGAVVLALALWLVPSLEVRADLVVSAPSAILMEATTGDTIYEKNATERRSPASLTKIMTILLTFEQIKAGNADLNDPVVVSEYASSMGGSQVWLEMGEIQTLDTMLKCIIVASGNDASVAVAEHLAGSEANFVAMMNERARELGMIDTHFEDCCGLSDSDNHYTSAKDVALMSRELITHFPEVFNYTTIWMEDIIHSTARGDSVFGLSNTNKLLKRYQYTTGLKTGTTDKALYCICATALKEDIHFISVVMGAPSSEGRFKDAVTMLNHGFAVSDLYIDENTENLAPLPIEGGVEEAVPLRFEGPFSYLDTQGNKLDGVEKSIELPAGENAPVVEGEAAGRAVYKLDGVVIGEIPIVYAQTVDKAGYLDYLWKVITQALMGI
ncbi:MAG: D-alanyl-D-alanine carboxypeptidase [Clostridium sp.]|nr:D-alanyl-D-alanine carboxypeptidase [Clostridium sp.]